MKKISMIDTTATGEERQRLITDEQLNAWFTSHPPQEGQAARYEVLRAQGLVLARLIEAMTPPGPDQETAIRKVREAVMTANAAIACEGPTYTSYYAQHAQEEVPK